METKPCKECGRKMIKAIARPMGFFRIATTFWWCACGHFETDEIIGILEEDSSRLRDVWEIMNRKRKPDPTPMPSDGARRSEPDFYERTVSFLKKLMEKIFGV